MSMHFNRIGGTTLDPVYAVTWEYTDSDRILFSKYSKEPEVEYRQGIVTKETIEKFRMGTGITNSEIERLFTVNPAQMSYKLPGINEAVTCPAIPKGKTQCEWGYSIDFHVGLRQMIMHLNDQHMWTREEIADYIESLPDQERFQF